MFDYDTFPSKRGFSSITDTELRELSAILEDYSRSVSGGDAGSGSDTGEPYSAGTDYEPPGDTQPEDYESQTVQLNDTIVQHTETVKAGIIVIVIFLGLIAGMLFMQGFVLGGHK